MTLVAAEPAFAGPAAAAGTLDHAGTIRNTAHNTVRKAARTAAHHRQADSHNIAHFGHYLAGTPEALNVASDSPPPPSGVKAVAVHNNIAVSWPIVPGVNHYVAMTSPAGGQCTSTVTSCAMFGVPDNTYTVYVVAYGTAGIDAPSSVSPGSAPVTTSTTVTTVPPAATHLPTPSPTPATSNPAPTQTMPFPGTTPQPFTPSAGVGGVNSVPSPAPASNTVPPFVLPTAQPTMVVPPTFPGTMPAPTAPMPTFGSPSLPIFPGPNAAPPVPGPAPAPTYAAPAPTYAGPMPAPTYAFPAPTYAGPMPAPTYAFPAPSYAGPIPAPSYAGPMPAPSYVIPTAVPAYVVPTYPVPPYAAPGTAPTYAAPTYGPPTYTPPTAIPTFPTPVPNYPTAVPTPGPTFPTFAPMPTVAPGFPGLGNIAPPQATGSTLVPSFPPPAAQMAELTTTLPPMPPLMPAFPAAATPPPSGNPTWPGVPLPGVVMPTATPVMPAMPGVGVPSAPQGLAAAPFGANGATVSWTAPASAGAGISHYTVMSQPGGLACDTADATTTFCTVTGLSNGTTYAFYAIATGPAGNSAVSQPSGLVTISAIDAPAAVVLTPGDGRLTVSWSTPTTGNAGIVGYSAMANPGGTTCSTFDPSRLTCDLAGLTNGVLYTVTVVAHKSGGVADSPASPALSGSPGVAPVTAPTPMPMPVPMPAVGAGALQPPTAVAAAGGMGVIGVAWNPSASSGVARYTATVSPGGQTCSTPDNSVSECLITGLTGGTAYTVTVVAVGSDGSVSQPSTPYGPVTPVTQK